MNWDDAYENTKYIPNGALYPDQWAKDAQNFRQNLKDRAQLNQPYGAHPREIYDQFEPESDPKGVFVFVHGGYWRAFDKSYWSHLAQGALERSFRVIIPSYPLCPEVQIGDITQSIAKLIKHLNQKSELHIWLAGHSAGGHLAARMMCKNMLPNEDLMRISHIFPISGLYDLRVFLATRMNTDFALNLKTAEAESPAFLEPGNLPITICVGEIERPEFIRQFELLGNLWREAELRTESLILPGRHHFNVIDGLADPNSPLINAILGD